MTPMLSAGLPSEQVHGEQRLCGRFPCMQLKKVLSSIPEAPLSVECLMNDIDFRSSMSREKMEELAAPILERARVPLAQVRARVPHEEGTWPRWHCHDRPGPWTPGAWPLHTCWCMQSRYWHA